VSSLPLARLFLLQEKNMQAPKLISLNEVCELTTLSRTMINNHRAAGNFPPAIPLGERRIAFIRAEVEAWIVARIAAARGQ
jgi:prophage regulatory protein